MDHMRTARPRSTAPAQPAAVIVRRPAPWIVVACLCAPGASHALGTLEVNGQRIEYWPLESAEPYAGFRVVKQDYQNTYRLDCRQRRFLWTENKSLKTGQITDNNAASEWRPITPASTLSNAVFDAVCPSLLNRSNRTQSAAPAAPPQPVITAEGGKGRWAWNDNLAITAFPDSGLGLGVLFAPDSSCNDAYFFIAGNDKVDQIGFLIDGRPYRSIAPQHLSSPGDARPIVGFPLSSQALSDLKHGGRLLVETNEGRLPVDLTGSAMAFNQAYGNCLRMQPGRPLTASTGGEPSTGKPTYDTEADSESAGTAEPDDAQPGRKNDKLSLIDGKAGKILRFNGPIEEGDAASVQEALNDSGARTLDIASDGGLISEAKTLGYFIRANGIDTQVGRQCASACVFVLAAGVNRAVAAEARVGLHQSSLKEGDGTLAMGQKIAAEHYQYFKTMGVDPEVAVIASKVPSDEILWLERERLTTLGLATRILPAAHPKAAESAASSQAPSEAAKRVQSERLASLCAQIQGIAGSTIDDTRHTLGDPDKVATTEVQAAPEDSQMSDLVTMTYWDGHVAFIKAKDGSGQYLSALHLTSLFSPAPSNRLLGQSRSQIGSLLGEPESTEDAEISYFCDDAGYFIGFQFNGDVVTQIDLVSFDD